MKLIFGLMLLLRTAACLEFNCWFHQSDPCYAALGHKLNVPMVNASKYKLRIVKRINNNPSDPTCRVRNDEKKECDLFNNRPEVTFSEGTLIINRVNTTDSGNYTLQLTSLSDGTVSYTDLQVNVEAPIGSVEVSVSCSSNGSKSVSCSSDGDPLIYSWTLNGESLMDGNTSIQLKEEDVGNIICSVKNHVSDVQKSITVQLCPGSTTAAVTSSLTSALTNSTPTPNNDLQISLIALCCVSLILILLFITACHFYKRKHPQSTTGSAGGTELLYAQISHDNHNKKSERKKPESFPSADVEYAEVRTQPKRKKKEEEVQYGEVTFFPKTSNAPQEPKEECVYSQVQRR